MKAIHGYKGWFALICSMILAACSEVQYKPAATVTQPAQESNQDALSRVSVRIEGQKVGPLIKGTVHFSEDVEGFDIASFVVNKGRIVELSGGPRNYAFSIDPMSTGTLKIQIPAKVVLSQVGSRFNAASNVLEFTFDPLPLDFKYNVFSFQVDEIAKIDPVDLILIVDDSHSMDPYQDRLSEALGEVVKKLKGRDLRVFLYSTTQVGRNTVDTQPHFFKNGVVIHNNYTGSYATALNQKTRGLYFGDYINNQATYQNESIAPALHRRSHFVKGGQVSAFDSRGLFEHDEIIETFQISKSAFKNDSGFLTVPSDIDEPALNRLILDLKSQVKLGSKGASNAELPLCTLAHYLMAQGEFKDTDNQRKKAFVILSDEDQSQLPCLVGFQSQQIRPEWVKVYPNSYYYETRVDVDVRGDQGSTTYVKRTIHFDRMADCLKDKESRCIEKNKLTPCSAADTDAAYLRFQQIHETRFQDGTYKVPAERKCYHHVRPIDPNFPAQFHAGLDVKQGTQCDDSGFVRKGSGGVEIPESESLSNYFSRMLPDFELLPNACNFDPFSHIQANAKWNYIDLSGYDQSLSKLIRTKAEQRFGRSNYLIATIGNLGESNPSSCEALVHERSTSLMDLADQGHTISICESRYTPLVEWMNRFVHYSPRQEYSLLVPRDKIVAVRLKGNNQQFLPDQYEIVDGKIVFKTQSLRGGDEIEVLWQE